MKTSDRPAEIRRADLAEVLDCATGSRCVCPLFPLLLVELRKKFNGMSASKRAEFLLVLGRHALARNANAGFKKVANTNRSERYSRTLKNRSFGDFGFAGGQTPARHEKDALVQLRSESGGKTLRELGTLCAFLLAG